MSKWRIVRTHWSFERAHHGAGWMLRIRPLRRGAGYRAYDFPWYSPSVHAPRWRRYGYISGRTIVLARNVKPAQQVRNGKPTRRRAWWLTVTKNGNPRYLPGWW